MHARHRPAAALRVPVLCLAATALVGTAGPVRAQSDDFTQPQVVLSTGGHQGPPREILFASGGTELVSAGFDKVVNIWGFRDGRPRLIRTLRPPIWRGPAGRIEAMALAPRPISPEDPSRYLAIAGFGVRVPRGHILVYRLPGAPAHPSGDVAFELPGREQREDVHRDTVMALAFDPSAATLASCSNDGTVRLWDIRSRKLLRVLEGHEGPVNALGFTPDGRRLVTGGHDGVLRVWDTATGALHASADPRFAPGDVDRRGARILALAVAGGAVPQVIVGRENGQLERFDLDDLMKRSALPTDLRRQGPVEGIAVSPDGSKLATSIISQRLRDPAEVPEVACDIEVRSLPDGRLLGAPWRTDNLVYALAFSPDGRLLAYGGGDEQAIIVRDLQRPERPALALAGEGRSVWEVGWSVDSRSVGFSRVPKPPADARLEAFHLFERKLESIAARDLHRTPAEWQGWRVRALDPLALELRSPDGRVTRIALDDLTERRWWCYGILPPGPGHAAPTLAVGCEAGVLIFDLATGRRNRLLAGHAGPVYALAASPDGRWLATGSVDQTVRIWPLAGIDVRPGLGLKIERGADGTYRVGAVDRLGFADRDRMRLEPGDVIERAYIRARPFSPDALPDFLAQADDAPPNTTIEMIVRRGQSRIPVMTTKRDSPVLSLFVGLDREWVLWMPQGYYETSIIGDRKYLLWHRNGPDSDAPTELFPADRFERELRLPDVLTTLLTTGNLAQALAAVPPAARDPEGLVAAGAPPRVRIAGPAGRAAGQALATNAPIITITPTVEATDGRSPIREVRIQVDGQAVLPPIVLAPPVARFVREFQVPMEPGFHRLSVVAINAQGRTRIEGFDVERTAPPAQKAPRFAILALGVAGPFQDGRIPPIPFAEEDARDLTSTYSSLASKAFRDVLVYPPVTDTSATSDAIIGAFDRLRSDQLGAGDTLMVLLESHLLAEGPRAYLIGTDAGQGDPPSNAVSADSLADLLAEPATRGAKVIVLIDGVHAGTPPAWASRVKEWVRGLYRRDVIAFIASNQGPSERYRADPHGAFVMGLLSAPTARGQYRPWVDPASAFTLDDFQSAVTRRVKELTGLRQQPACYFPETISPSARLFDAGKSDE